MLREKKIINENCLRGRIGKAYGGKLSKDERRSVERDMRTYLSSSQRNEN
jgi:hypothetical protein